MIWLFKKHTEVNFLKHLNQNKIPKNRLSKKDLKINILKFFVKIS